MKCPRCIEKMENTNIQDVDAHTCFYCNGVWVGGQSLRVILQQECDSQLNQDIHKSLESIKLGKVDRYCPECENQRLLQISLRDIELDLCPQCNGIYFDEGELKMLLPQLENRSKSSGLGSYLIGEGVYWAILAILIGKG
ncbi:MAG: zf-TFIIB domain-containing protein [Candidatus Thiodiazotropha taylori]